MEWQLERQLFRDINPTLNRNSQLKKKMIYGRRIKNLDNSNIKELIPELLVENMEQFYSEIISTILIIRPNNTNEIKNIIRVFCVYLKDENFVSLLFGSLSKELPDCLKISTYWYLLIYVEIKSILDLKFNILIYLKDFYNKSRMEVKILILEYLVDFVDSGESKEMVERERKSIEMYVINEQNYANYSYELERVFEACKKVGIKILEEKKTDNDFKPIIAPFENVFEWYTLKNERSEQFRGSLTPKEIVEYIKNYFNDSSKIDALCRILKQSDNFKVIPGLISKFKGNICYFPALARILKGLGSLSKKTINRLIEELYNSRKTSDKKNEQINNVIFISELIKFRAINPNEVFSLLDHFLKLKEIELYCLLLKNIGRFYLIDENTNYKTREYLDKAINLGNRSKSIECLYVNDMISRIFPSKKETGWRDFLDFIAYFTQQETFNEDGEAWKVLKRNRRFLFMLFLRPWEFKDLTYVAYLIDRVNLIDPVIDFIFVLFKTLIKESKMKTIAFAQLLGKVLKYKKTVLQEELLKNIMELEIEVNMKVRILLASLVDANFYVKQRFLIHLKAYSALSKDPGTHALIFNFSEEIGVKGEEGREEDSFEEEIKYLNGV